MLSSVEQGFFNISIFCPENVVCCTYSRTLDFIMKANTMNPDQTALKGAV